MSPKVTVVIPTIRPRRYFLKRAGSSVMAQTLPQSEIAVEIAIDRDRAGSAGTRNRALMKAKTAFVAFLDDDDYFMPHHLEFLLSNISASSPIADVMYTGCKVIGPDRQEIPLQEEWGRFGKPFDGELLRKQSYIPVTSMVDTELAQEALFGAPDHDPNSPYDDWGFYLRLLDLGASFMHVPEVTWVWDHHGKNTSGQGDRW